jgi:hypothetical protein
MSTEAASNRKRKPTEESEAVVSSDDDRRKIKARRVSTDTSASASSKLMIAEGASDSEQSESASNAQQDESMASIGKMIQDLFHSDNAKVGATFAALNLDLVKDKKKCDKIQAVGGCFVLVHLMNKCLDKAIDRFPACDQVAALNELPEVTTLHKTLSLITNLTFNHYDSKVGIAAIGGMEAVIKVMQTFPKCQTLQERAFIVVLNLACCSIGKMKVVEAGGMEVILAAVSNHLGSAYICERACLIIINLIADSNDNTEEFICLGGATAVAKVKNKWPGNYRIQNGMRHLSKSIAAHFIRWGKDELRKRCP